MSQAPREGDADLDRGEEIPPAAIAAAARRAGCQSVSYTYTEPTVYFEYAHAIMGEAVGQGLRNVFVSNGYQSPACVEACRGLLHAANIDLKAFRDGFYRQNCQARLAPVLDTLKRLFAMGVWLEITTLLISGQNDDPAELGELAGFIVKELAPWVPWHVSAYTPRYKYARQGPPPTPPATLERALAIGRQAGLHYVYAGNPSATRAKYRCPLRRAAVERRLPGAAERLADGHCPGCGAAIPGVWGERTAPAAPHPGEGHRGACGNASAHGIAKLPRRGAAGASPDWPPPAGTASSRPASSWPASGASSGSWTPLPPGSWQWGHRPKNLLGSAVPPPRSVLRPPA